MPQTYIRLFSYGSNTPDQVASRLELRSRDLRAFERSAVAAYLPKHGRVFRGMSRNWGGGTASVVRDNDRNVYGYVAEVPQSRIELLDLREGALMRQPKYKRVKKYVMMYDSEEGGFVRRQVEMYVSTSRQFNPPTDAYLKAIVKMLNRFWSGGGRIRKSDIPIV